MKVLMLTQAVDPGSDLLGFVPSWIRALAARVESLYVLAGKVQPTTLPANVEVCSLGKESGKGRLTRLARFYRGLKEAVKQRGVDVIFAHMNPEYVLASRAVTARPVVLWYTHTAVTRRLKLAVRLAARVVTASRESFKLETEKLRVTGHGIDLAPFPATPPPGGWNLLSVGRLDAVKDFETVIEGAALLRKKQSETTLTLVGDGPRREALESLARERKLPVTFAGKVPWPEIPARYRACDLFVSATKTALDKAVLEAMASARPVVGCHPAVTALLPKDHAFPPGDAAGLAAAAGRVLSGDRAAAGRSARATVEREHSLEAMMDRLVGVLRESAK